MQRSKSKDADRSKELPSRHLDSDGSGSVVSLQSSSSDDGKYPGSHHLGGSGQPGIQMESVEELGAQKGAGNRLERLQQKLYTQPTQDTLDEIINTMKNQNNLKDSSPAGVSLPLHNDSTVGGKTYPSLQSYAGSSGWNSTSPLQMSGNPKFGEKHARQFKDITVHFESEVDKIHEQLNSVGSSLSALQDALPVKMLEAANHKLEARCNVLEQVCEQIKNKSARLEQANQELDSNCGQLRQINQNLEVRCLFLEQVTQANESEKTHLQENVRDLESKVMELAARNEKAIGACRQLEEINQKLENKSQSIEESKKLLESRYKSCVSDNQKLEAQIGQCQKMLDQYKKKVRDFEEAIATSKREKDSLAMKLESSNKRHMEIKQKYEELKTMCAAKDELIARLENEMRERSVFVEKTIKEKTEAEVKSKKDKELLQRMLVEYDSLARDYQEAQDSHKSLRDKLEISESEMASLRVTISKLVSRNSILEEASKGDYDIQDNRHVELPTGKNKLFTGRKMWEHSTPIKKREPQGQSLAPPFITSPEIGRDAVSSELVTACQPYPTSVVHSGTPTIPDVMKLEPSSGRKRDLSSSGPKSSATASQGKRQQAKSDTMKESSDVVRSAPYSVMPGGMTVKKTDLLTRFDVVFEDAKSGEEMTRTHTGRTRRVYGEPPQTESSFSTAGHESAGGIAGSDIGTTRDTRLLAVEDYESTRLEPRKTKSKQSAMYKVAEKDIGVKTGQAASKYHGEENENEMYAMERKFSMLTEERKRLESTLSRIPAQKMTKRSKEDKAYLENRLDEVIKEVGLVRAQLTKHHTL